MKQPFPGFYLDWLTRLPGKLLMYFRFELPKKFRIEVSFREVFQDKRQHFFLPNPSLTNVVP